MIKWRLGLDSGTNSIGWAAILLDEKGKPAGLLDAGVRIFSDGRNPKDGQSLAVQRRAPRSARRNRDRYLLRRDRFMDLLIDHGLMPADKAARKALETLDPWALRVRGLDGELNLHELGRALFHLQQRRGFKSNRKTDKGADDESGKIKSAAKAAREAMAEKGARTLGEFLAAERVSNSKSAHEHSVRARLHGTGAKAFYDFYPTRDMIEEEFEALWNAQAPYHPGELSEAARSALHKEMFFQRPLKPQPVGKCTLIPTEERAPRALPSVQRLRIYQEINHLTVRMPGGTARKLTLAERNRLVEKALNSPAITFEQMRRLLKLPEGALFNFESEKRKGFDGDKTAALLAKIPKKGAPLWGPAWRDLNLVEQDAIIERLLAEEDEDALTQWLMGEHGHDAETALAIANLPLPDGHGALGRTACARVLAELESTAEEKVNAKTGEIYTAPFTYDQAVKLAGFEDHSFFGDGEAHTKLPYYGEVLERHVAFGTGEPTDSKEKRYGKIANPTVHVVMNQIRRVVNKLIQAYGPPEEIVVELARELPMSAEGKKELEREQKKNQDANERRKEELAKLGIANSYENRLRLRLWEELNKSDPCDRRCPYTGEQISIERLFSPEIEIEHILPFSQTLDDGIGNKTLCVRQANRDKGQRSPFDAFGHSPAGYDWAAISARAGDLLPNKSWRFSSDAMQRFEDTERGFLDRQLNDTKYAARLMRQYLTHVIPSDDPQKRLTNVWVTPGRLTSDLRHVWGLNSVLQGHNTEEAVDPKKNRNDHRHHAIDAVVIALTDRGLLKSVATNAARAEQQFDTRLLAGLGAPWPDFRETVREAMDRLVVSHKPDHGLAGALHNDTAYGLVEPADAAKATDVVHRVPLASMSKSIDLNAIRDGCLRDRLRIETDGLTGKEFTTALVAAGEALNPPVRKVRIVEKLRVIPIGDGSGHTYKAYKGDSNYCYDIFDGPKEKWTGTVVSRFEANQSGFDPNAKFRPDGQPILMRIRGGDMVAIEEGSASRRIMRVVKFSTGQIVLAEHKEAGSLKTRDADKTDDFKYLSKSPSGLQALRARLIHVDEMGRVYDPGPPQ